MTIHEQYSSIPVLNRYGSGAYTYKLVIDTGSEVYKYEIFADSVEVAVFYITTNIGVVVNINYISSDVVQLRLENYYKAVSYLYI